jgi:hypothetical protein
VHENIEGLRIHRLCHGDFKADELGTYGAESENTK